MAEPPPIPIVAPGGSRNQPATGRRGRASAPAIVWRRQLPAVGGLALLIACGWMFMIRPLPSGASATPSGVDAGSVEVIIDPGHGGEDSGAVAQGVVEKTLNLDVGQRVAQLLRAHGHGVRLTREDDRFVPLETRVRLGNALPNAVFVSIHFNDASGDGRAAGRASGVETFYCERKLMPGTAWTWTTLFGVKNAGASLPVQAIHEGQLLADFIQSSLVAGTAATDRGIKERSLYVTHWVLGPSVLVEGGFVSNAAEARRLGDSAYRQKIADSIAAGIEKYLGASRQPRPPLVALAAGT